MGVTKFEKRSAKATTCHCFSQYYPLLACLRWWFTINLAALQNHVKSEIKKKKIHTFRSYSRATALARISWVESENLVFKNLYGEVQVDGIRAHTWQAITSRKQRVVIKSGNTSKHIINALIDMILQYTIM